jgi:hypothetical protein
MTDTVHFLGLVLPQERGVSIGYDPTIQWKEPALLDFEPAFVVHIKQSNVDVECRLDTFRVERYAPLYIRAFDLARAAVDLVAFSTGASLTVIFTKFVHPDGKQEPIAPQNSALGALCTAFRINAPSTDKSFDQVFKIVVGDHELFMALRDLIDANTLPHIGIINCGRVLDGIKRMISPGEKDQARAWAAMQSALNISRPYQQWVTDLSANPRHADRSHITGADTTEALKRTWSVINRFLAFRKQGNKPLTAPDFPMLNP